MLDCRPMSELRLRFSDGDQPDLVVGAGVHALGRLPTGLGPVDAEQPWLLRVSNDRRGLWLTVAEGLRGVHVNGRPVQHVAMLRAGDSIHVDGGELLLVAANDGRAVAACGRRARPDRQPAAGPARPGRYPPRAQPQPGKAAPDRQREPTPTCASTVPASPRNTH
jgi:hypothetical protein